MKFTIPVAPRTKKNSQSFVTLKTGRTLLLPSKTYKEFEKNVVLWAKANLFGFKPISNPVNMDCKFYMDKNYKSDLVGYLQAIQDALIKAKVIEDDNHNIISTVNGSEVLLDRKNPRIEVTITPKELKDNVVPFPKHKGNEHQITVMEAIERQKGDEDD